MKQEILGIKKQLPNEITSKLENFTFTNATISAFDYGLMD
jgi:hypothetical protein